MPKRMENAKIAFDIGVHSVYVGSLFVFKNKDRNSILINVPDRRIIDNANV
jgi:hypothetical protein